MPSLRKLNGVAHDVAHHSQSALGWLHPHLFKACRMCGTLEATLDLLAANPYPRDLPNVEPLRLACGSLQVWFCDLLNRLGYKENVVRSVVLHFQFRPDGDGFDTAVSATLTTFAGKVHSAGVDYIAGWDATVGDHPSGTT